MRLITSRHIMDWAATRSRDCQDTLPLLVRRLVRATARDLRRLDVPAGDAVSEEGWDGRVVCTAESPFLPDGASGWEIGTDVSAKGKADRDYDKRTAEPLDLVPGETTFVFVSPRAWPRRHAWVAERRSEGRWRDVRVLAAGEIEAWLEEVPAVALWLAAHLGLAPAEGFRALGDWWDDWAAATRPVLTPAMLLGGREREAEGVRVWLSGPPASLEFQGDAPEEAIAFLHAASTRLAAADAEALAARCVVAETEAAFRAAAAWPTPIVIAALADVAQSGAGAALRRGHHLYLGVGGRLGSRGGGPRRLPRVDAYALSNALVDKGLDRDETARAVVECGRSIPVLRRRRSALDAIRCPAWAEPENAGVLIPALLAGGWSEVIRQERGPFGPPPNPLLDRAVLHLLGADSDYGVFASALRRLCAGDDPPLRDAAAVWRLAAPIDAWFLAGRSVTARDLDRLAEAAFAVLPRPDPRYELPEEDRWLANVRGKERPHSGWLREGLAISLAVVAQHGEVLGLSPSGGMPVGWAAAVVRGTLAGIQGWQGWASVSDVLPLLGEAAPDEVLDALDAFLAQTVEVRFLLSDGSDRHFGGECRHAGILWTLERLAWHPKHVARCCAILARLDAVDPGGRWANRPLGSLVDVLFWGGDPYTFADADGLLAAVDAACVAAPETGWRLLLAAYAPALSRLVRDPPAILAAKPDGWRPLSQEQVRRIAEGLEVRLASLIRSAGEDRVVAALGCVERLPPAAQTALAAWLDGAVLAPPPNGEDAIWQAVRAALRRNRSFDRDGRRLVEGVEDAFRRADVRMTPSDPRSRAAWLFRQDPALSDAETRDWRKDQKRLEGMRAAVAKDLMELLPAEELVSFGSGLEAGWALGVALADVPGDEDEKLARAMLALARSEQTGIPGLLLAYCDRRWRGEGSTWFDRWLAVAAHAPDAPAATAALLTILPREGATWRRVESNGEDVERLYWRWVWPVLDDNAPSEDRVHAVGRLLTGDRVGEAMRLAIERRKSPLPGSALVPVADALVRMLAAPDAAQRANLIWEIDELFTRMDEAGDIPQAELARLEWCFLPILVDTGRGARSLGAILATEPDTFADLISWVYRAEGKNEEVASKGAESNAAERSRAESAFQLLEHWHGPLPGMTDSGIDRTTLLQWVQEAHRRCHESGRGPIGDQKIGALLAHAPADPEDGVWPHRAVRAALDELRAEHIDVGFTIGIHNKRGVTVRNPLDGGAQERDLAAQYDAWASVSQGSSPHTARLLRQVAESYRADARWEDDQARLNDLR